MPPLALRFPVKKLAAAVALAAAAFYLLLSGASVPTQRSFLMTAVALVAVIVDRNPFSLRLLAWSALVVLVLRPESVLGASFQLSFAAVLALMVVYEGWQRRVGATRRRARAAGAGLALSRWASPRPRWWPAPPPTPLAAFHFQTIPTYGVLANLVAVPLTSFLVMPAGMVGLLLMPLGLDGPAFQVMALGRARACCWTARAVAALPGASVLVHAVARSRRWLCCRRRVVAGPLAAALALARAGAVCRGGSARARRAVRRTSWSTDALAMAAVRHADGTVTLIEWRRDRLVRDVWLRQPRRGRAAARAEARARRAATGSPATRPAASWSWAPRACRWPTAPRRRSRIAVWSTL